MFRNDPCSGPYKCLDVVPLTIRGDTLVTMSYYDNCDVNEEIFHGRINELL